MTTTDATAGGSSLLSVYALGSTKVTCCFSAAVVIVAGGAPWWLIADVVSPCAVSETRGRDVSRGLHSCYPPAVVFFPASRLSDSRQD